jgi:hypothetical protein
MRGNTDVVKSVKVGGNKSLNPRAFAGKTFEEFKTMYSGRLDAKKAFEKVQKELSKIQTIKPKKVSKPVKEKKHKKEQTEKEA